MKNFWLDLWYGFISIFTNDEETEQEQWLREHKEWQQSKKNS